MIRIHVWKVKANMFTRFDEMLEIEHEIMSEIEVDFESYLLNTSVFGVSKISVNEDGSAVGVIYSTNESNESFIKEFVEVLPDSELTEDEREEAEWDATAQILKRVCDENVKRFSEVILNKHEMIRIKAMEEDDKLSDAELAFNAISEELHYMFKNGQF